MATRSIKALVFLGIVTAVLVMAPMALGVAGPGNPTNPDVDGCFYGECDTDGSNDKADYGSPLAEALGGRGFLYGKVVGNTLFMAVEVNVNDNVFDWENPYPSTAGWGSHKFMHLEGSDNLQMRLRCNGAGGTTIYTWGLDYLYDADAGTGYDWQSGPDGTDGFAQCTLDQGTCLNPPSLQADSSLAWNLNNYDSSAWDVTQGGADSKYWKSPDRVPAGTPDDDVTNEDGWDGDWFDNYSKWEWKMVYEMSLDVSGCDTASVSVINAHNSPSKDSDPDVPIPVADFGDAPDSYKTVIASGGAQHNQPIVGPSPFMGYSVDTEPDGQPSVGAVGDDGDADGNDEQGVCFCAGPLHPGQAAQVKLLFTDSPLPCTLSAWIDFDADGDFDPGDQLTFTSGPNGTNTYPTQNPVLTPGADYHLGFDIPANAEVGLTYTRFRCTTDGPVGFNGVAWDGEVEDHLVWLTEDGVEYDFGDLPYSYGTRLEAGGAFHLITSGLALGMVTDGEGNGRPSEGSDGDDDCGPASDDEDGILPAGASWTTGPGGGSVDICVTGTGLVYGWLDWGQDGTLDDPGDRILDGVLFSDSYECKTLPIDVPVSVDGKSFYVRFRLYEVQVQASAAMSAAAPLAPEQAPSPTGDGGTGEVQDYVWSFSPTAVSVANLTASGGLPVWLAVIGLAALVLALAGGALLLRQRMA